MKMVVPLAIFCHVVYATLGLNVSQFTQPTENIEVFFDLPNFPRSELACKLIA